MNHKLKEIFRGKVVNKAQPINAGIAEFPRYVLEYLIDNYCGEETFRENMEAPRNWRDDFIRRGSQ
jgi:ATP-dependent Lon protease